MQNHKLRIDEKERGMEEEQRDIETKQKELTKSQKRLAAKRRQLEDRRRRQNADRRLLDQEMAQNRTDYKRMEQREATQRARVERMKTEMEMSDNQHVIRREGMVRAHAASLLDLEVRHRQMVQDEVDRATAMEAREVQTLLVCVRVCGWRDVWCEQIPS